MKQNHFIKCTFSNLRFTSKPEKEQAKTIQFDLKPTDISIEELAEALVHGASFRPAVLYGRKKTDWKEQQLFGLDFDHNTTIEEKYQKAIQLGIVPCFLYTTFSHSEKEPKFRMLFCNDRIITDGNYRDKLQATLMGIMEDADPVCFNRDRLFYGGRGEEVLHPDYNARIHAETIIEKYWKEEFTVFLSGNKGKKDVRCKKKSENEKLITWMNGLQRDNLFDNPKKDSITVRNNVDAISTRNISLLQERLGLKGDKVNTDRRRYSLLVFTQSPEEEKEDKNGNEIYQFQSEAEMYNYINSIDLQEYLGVSSDTFCCILPTHEDNRPSAHIYITDDGTQIYKCFGCNQARTIISITEQLAHCKRSEAIDFIKKVYKIDYKPSEWVEKQRQLMIDSALYLDSEEFKETFPQINKLIRTRKTDIQKILMHMTKYINNGLELEGKPLFFASLTSLMKVCERNSKPKMSQSITLFTLLNMLNKVELNSIPEEELKKAKHISAKYGFQKVVNFYQVEEYGFETLEDSEKIAATLLENNITLKGLSREYILRTFGIATADKVYPQYKFENRQGTSEKSDYLTGEIALQILETIQRQGYFFEKEVNHNGKIGTQWKKSIQEILDCYGLQRVKLNKELKEKYHIESKGYPYIIIEDPTFEIQEQNKENTNLCVKHESLEKRNNELEIEKEFVLKETDGLSKKEENKIDASKEAKFLKSNPFLSIPKIDELEHKIDSMNIGKIE